MIARPLANLSKWLAAGLILIFSCAKPHIDIPLVDLPSLPGMGPPEPEEFAYNWMKSSNRTWIGPEFWANRLQDWRLQNGRLECVSGRLPYRTLHLLSHRISPDGGDFRAEIRLGLAGAAGEKGAEAGFLIGAGSKDLDYRAAALIQSAPGPEGGLLAGINADGHLFFKDFHTPPKNQSADELPPSQQPIIQMSAAALEHVDDVRLFLRVEEMVPTEEDESEVELAANEGDTPSPTATAADGTPLYRIVLAAYKSETLLSIDAEQDEEPQYFGMQKPLAEIGMDGISAERLAGNLALFANQQGVLEGEAPPRFWFRDWRGNGVKLSEHSKHHFGPILCAQHTLSRGVLKMTAQLPPLADEDFGILLLQTKQDAYWTDVAMAEVVQPGWTATFRVEDWPTDENVDYRILMEFGGEDFKYHGTVQHDPVDEKEVVMAAFTGNHAVRHGFGREGYPWTEDALWFPHADLVKRVEKHKPDLLFFSGDQIYEGASPTFADRKQPFLDYSYKWYLWCWAFGDLARDLPCVTIPDDHDIYQGNLWGQGGRAAERDHNGGYIMPAEFVKMVERTQTSHLPDPWSVAPLEQDILPYYTDMLYGRISFAILEDRKFKSGPAGVLTHDGKRPDHITDPEIDPKTVDVDEAVLLGEEQLKFLNHWATSWEGADLKAALSQTIFGAMATHHGSNLERVIMDMDSNGWPQKGRRRALEVLRSCMALMIGGDQHLATVVHHGIKTWDDAGFSFCVPSIANFYPRAWRPKGEPAIPLAEAGALPFTGSFKDGFGNFVTVYAHTNPDQASGHEPASLHDGMPGYGIIRFNKPNRTMKLECWPRWANPSEDEPYPGWPFVVEQMDNLGREPSAWLPTLRVSGMRDPVVQVIDEFENEIIYTLRIKGQTFQPPVFLEGKYTIRVGDLDSDRKEVLRGVRATETNDKFLIVDI